MKKERKKYGSISTLFSAETPTELKVREGMQLFLGRVIFVFNPSLFLFFFSGTPLMKRSWLRPLLCMNFHYFAKFYQRKCLTGGVGRGKIVQTFQRWLIYPTIFRVGLFFVFIQIFSFFHFSYQQQGHISHCQPNSITKPCSIVDEVYFFS